MQKATPNPDGKTDPLVRDWELMIRNFIKDVQVKVWLNVALLDKKSTIINISISIATALSAFLKQGAIQLYIKAVAAAPSFIILT